MNIVVILNNIRSNENVGSIFRTSDAVGVSKIVLVGYTPAPLDRFKRENKALAKAALGAEKSISWKQVETLKEAIGELKKEDYKIVAIEQGENAVDYKTLKSLDTKNIALVFGNEVTGLSKEEMELCDVIAELPMKGEKESLNVAVCVGVALYSLL